jgi:hypothetical protein
MIAEPAGPTLGGRRAVPGLGAIVVVVALSYAATLWSFDGLPYQDVPNHLSRAVAIADLLFHGGREYGGTFTFEWQFVPYVLGDAFHAATVELLSPSVAARTWVVLSVLALPAATWLLMREWGADAAVRALAAACALFLSADWFLRLGFLNFKYALALTLLAVAAWERLVSRPSVRRALAYGALVVAGYLTHLSALVFVVVIVGTLSLLRVIGDVRALPRYAVVGLPLLALLGWHLLFRGSAEVGESVQPALATKLLRVGGVLAPTRDPLDVGIALAFIVTIAVPLAAGLRRVRDWPVGAREGLAVAVAFGGVYLVLPETKGLVWGVDIRALPLAWLFVCCTVVAILPRPALVRATCAVAAIAAVQLASLGTTLAADDALMKQYREVAARVPTGATVLAVVSRPRRGGVSPTAHAASFATIDARAVLPYTFTGDTGAPVPYFNFRARLPPYPWQWWYLNRDPPYPAARLFTGYDYLLVQQPVDWRRIPRVYDVVDRNSAVVLAKVRPTPDPRAARSASASR